MSSNGGGAFSLDGKLFKGLTRIGDFMILGILTIVMCVPVVTMGGALSAALYTGMRLIRNEEGYVTRDFFRALKRNFLQGLIIEIIMGILGGVLFFDIRICYRWGHVQGSQFGSILMYAIIGIALVWLAVLLFALAMLARYDNKVLSTIKNALIVCVHHLPQTIILLIATYGILYFSSIYLPVIVLTVPVILYVDSFIFVRIFKALEDGGKDTDT